MAASGGDQHLVEQGAVITKMMLEDAARCGPGGLLTGPALKIILLGAKSEK